MSRSSIPRALRDAVFARDVGRLRKADKTAAVDPKSGTLVPLFHPLLHVWSEHFQLTRDATCVGTTSVGRATVEALQMNASVPRFARACQIALGLLDAG